VAYHTVRLGWVYKGKLRTANITLRTNVELPDDLISLCNSTWRCGWSSPVCWRCGWSSWRSRYTKGSGWHQR
jgi:hypothetical protein